MIAIHSQIEILAIGIWLRLESFGKESDMRCGCGKKRNGEKEGKDKDLRAFWDVKHISKAIRDFHNVFKFHAYSFNKRLFLMTAKLAGAFPT